MDKTNAVVEAQIYSLLYKFSKAVSNRDLDKVMDLFSPDEDLVSIGSEEGESAFGPNEFRSFLQRALSRPGSIYWEWSSRITMLSDKLRYLSLKVT